MSIKNIMLLADAYAERYAQSFESVCENKDAGFVVPSIEEVRSELLSALEMLPTIKQSSTVHTSAEDYLRYKYGAYRGHFAWRELEEAYSQGRYDEEQAQGPSPWPGGMEEFEIRGKLASGLKCWHRLTGEESENLIAFFAKQRYAAEQPAQSEPI